VAAKLLDDRGSVAPNTDGEFVEEGVIQQFNARNSAEHIGQQESIGVIDARKPAQARFAEQRQVDRKRKRAEAGVGADIRGRLLAPNVLLARRESEHKAALALGIDG